MSHNGEVPDGDVLIDLNADLGEGFGRWVLTDDDALLGIVSSANVACGFHAGDASTMHRVCALAAQRGVTVGAQVSYQDLAGFGRRAMDVPAGELADQVLYQIGALEAFAAAEGVHVAYVKPHGALYNRVVWDADQASAVLDAASSAGGLPVLGLPGSVFLRAAAGRGIPVVAEGFADRAYAADGSLVERSRPGAVLDDPEEIARRCVRMARERCVEAQDGTQITVDVRSLCVHGDSPGAVEVARRVRAALQEAAVRVTAFA
jgi:5-oxoprolinase (ATP-hydrolysing) subunit A